MEEKIELAYTAGIIDGEGCIGIHRHTSTRAERYYLSVQVGNTEKEMIDRLRHLYGGTVCSSTPKAGAREAYYWKINSSEAYHFLLQILPYLGPKRKQAELAIHFQESRHSYGCNTYTEAQRSYEQSCYEILKSYHH